MKLLNRILIAACAVMALTACDDYLDVVPDTRVKLETVEQCRMLLVTGYNDYSYSAIGELSSDNVDDNNAPSSTGVRYNRPSYAQTDDELYAWQDVKSGMGSDTPSGVWTGCYGAIACANAVLEALDKLDAEGKVADTERDKFNAVKGEALLIRAYHHFILTSIFCMPYSGPNQTDPGITYITSPETKVSPQYDRGTVAQDYEMIEKDLLAGIDLINDNFYEIPKYHFNKRAAYAFAARFFLFKRDYSNVLKYADLVFEGNDPLAMMNDIWGKSSQFYEVANIGKYYTSIERPGVFMCLSNYSTWRRRVGYRYTLNREAKRCTVEGPGPTWRTCRWVRSQYTDEFNKTFAMHPCFRGFCYYSGDSEWGTFFVGTMCEQFEYTDKIQGIGYAHMVRAEFTAEETLLCRAEAKAFMNDLPGCLADLKVWDDAHRNGLSTSDTRNMIEMNDENLRWFYDNDNNAENFGIVKDIHIDEVCPNSTYPLTADITPYVQCVQHFRRIDQVHTGMRWFDIKRLGLEITHKIGRNGVDKLVTLDKRYAIQIPTEVLSAGVEPNPREDTKPSTGYVAKSNEDDIML